MKTLRIVLLIGLAAGCALAQTAINSVTLTWAWAQGSGVAANGFNIYRASSAAGPYTQIGTVAATATAYTDSTTASAPAGTSFYYYIAAFSTANNLSAPSAIIGVIPAPTLSAPTGVTAQIK